MYQKKKGIIFIISAPSGTGKTTICNKIIEKCPDINLAISTTSRSPRKNEKDGKDYYFISKDEFESNMSDNKFVEWTTVLGNYYGTEHEEIKRYIKEGKDVVLNINVDGGRAIKSNYPDSSVLIFILPPSLAELKKRLKKRGSEKTGQVNQRLDMAKHEFETIPEYNYLLVNETIDKTVEDAEHIMKAEKYQTHRYNLGGIIRKLKEEKV